LFRAGDKILGVQKAEPVYGVRNEILFGVSIITDMSTGFLWFSILPVLSWIYGRAYIPEMVFLKASSIEAVRFFISSLAALMALASLIS
jgi:hypothetical protein